MAKYRGKTTHRKAHPRIYIFSHTQKAEIEYFQEFKNYLETPLLSLSKEKCWTPQELINKIIEWKKTEINDNDNDSVWCIFDVDDFYKKDGQNFLKAIKEAHNNNVKIAYINECFELWILLHFEKPTSAIQRGNPIENKIQKHFKTLKLGTFTKNQKVFNILLPYQKQAIKNATALSPKEYTKIDWQKALDVNGNPSTSIHFLIKEIYELIKNS